MLMGSQNQNHSTLNFDFENTTTFNSEQNQSLRVGSGIVVVAVLLSS
jgi:hypothetical protein